MWKLCYCDDMHMSQDFAWLTQQEVYEYKERTPLGGSPWWKICKDIKVLTKVVDDALSPQRGAVMMEYNFIGNTDADWLYTRNDRDNSDWRMQAYWQKHHLAAYKFISSCSYTATDYRNCFRAVSWKTKTVLKCPRQSRTMQTILMIHQFMMNRTIGKQT